MPSFLTNLLTVFTGMVGVYIAFALLASWINEKVAAMTQLRAKTLLTGIEQLVGTETAGALLQSSFLLTLGEPKAGMSAGNAGQLPAPAAQQPQQLPAARQQQQPPAAPQLLSRFRIAYFLFRPTAPIAGSNRRAPPYIPARQFALATLAWLQSAPGRGQAYIRKTAQDLLRETPPLPQALRSELNALDQNAAGDASFAAAVKASTTLEPAVRAANVGAYPDLANIVAAAAGNAQPLDDAEALAATTKLLAGQPAALPPQTQAQLAAVAQAAHPQGTNFLAALLAAGASLRTALDAEFLNSNQQSAMESILAVASGAADATVGSAGVEVAQLRQDLAESIDRLPAGPMRTALLTLFRSAQGDVDNFTTGIENWFDDHMDRVTGWYKRSAQVILIWIALALSLSFNVDSVAVFAKLNSNADLAAHLAAVSEGLDKRRAAASPGATLDDVLAPRSCPTPAPAAKNSTAAQGGTDCQTCAGYGDGYVAAGPQCRLDSSVLAQLPLGWSQAKFAQLLNAPDKSWNWHDIGSKVVGLALTTIAILLGAPFWFDVLSKVISVRSTGPKPLKSDTAPS